MEKSERFKKNIAKWAMTYPTEAEKLCDLEVKNVEFIDSNSGDLNLKRKDNGQTYHSIEDPQEEAQKWYSCLDLYHINTLFVFGVGLGYYYQAAKAWLRNDPERHLVFIEDDKEVIASLFQTDKGAEIVHDPQVTLLSMSLKLEKDLSEIDMKFSSIPYRHFIADIKVSALGYYAQNREQELFLLDTQLYYFKNIKIYQLMEYMSYGGVFFRNFYRNLLELPKAFFLDSLFGKFNGVPAIICGAGPSIDKNLDVLKKLSDRALIFAGGSALNAVTASGFHPHWGVGIDPNLGQYVRMMMNQAYETPFIYRGRFFPDALQSIHGPRMFLSGSSGYPISKWMQQRLNIDETFNVSEGNNVTNLSLSIAHALGCNPIIFVGLDLAFTDERFYGAGVIRHPLYDLNQMPQSKGVGDEVIYRPDIKGKPVPTLWKWVTESYWYSEFQSANRDKLLINATEGGIVFDNIVHMPLTEAAERYLRVPFDFNALVHGSILNSTMPSQVTLGNIKEIMIEIGRSLQKCIEIFVEMQQEFVKEGLKVQDTNIVPRSELTDRSLQLLRELRNELAYTNVIETFNECFFEYFGQKDFIDQSSSIEQNQVERAIKKAALNAQRYEFLESVGKVNLQHLTNALEEQRLKEIVDEAFQNKPGRALAEMIVTGSSKESVYTVENGRMKISDPEMGIQIDESINTNEMKSGDKDAILPQGQVDGKLILNYPEGNPKCVQHYMSGRLHGPSTAYTHDGKLIYSGWYVNGLKQGKTFCYYPSGKPYSVLRYRDGLLDGKQEYYYEEGGVKSSIEYKNGLLDGCVTLYYPNQVTKREIHFVDGKRNGTEHFRNIGGILELEIEWNQDKPIGACKGWYGHGKLGREVVYDENSNLVSVKAWSPEGVPMPVDNIVNEDYFTKVTKEAKVLSDSFETMINQINTMVPEVQKMMDDSGRAKAALDVTRDLIDLKHEMEHLIAISERMKSQTDTQSSSAKEAILKTPESQRLLGKQIEEATKGMTDNIVAAEEALRLTSEILRKSSGDKKTKSSSDG